MSEETQVRIVEVGPRDGLQNEKVHVPTATKIAFVEALVAAGHRHVEATAFVSKKAVPAMADAKEVMAGVPRREGLSYLALVPNARGAEDALEVGVDTFAVFTAASETFNQKNIRASIEESFARFEPVFEAARAAGKPVRAYVSTILHCPYEGKVDPAVTIRLVKRLLAAGAAEVSLGETIGKATPHEIADLCERLRAEGLIERVAGHFHDTYGMGVANVAAAYAAGVRSFDASAGGLGGCPYAPGAAGNVATEDLLWFFQGAGIPTGIDLDAQLDAAAIIEAVLPHELPGRTYRALRGV